MGRRGKKEKKLAQMRENCGCSNERGKLRCYGMRLEMGGRISSLWIFVWVCVCFYRRTVEFIRFLKMVLMKANTSLTSENQLAAGTAAML